MAKLEDVLQNFEIRLIRIENQLSHLSGSQKAGITTENQKSIYSVNAAEPSQPSSAHSAGSPAIASAVQTSPSTVQFSPDAPLIMADRSSIELTKVRSQNRSAGVDSSSVLGIIGIIFVILAGVFFIKMTLDSDWLTPARQILLAGAAGLAFFFAPQVMPKAEREYGGILAGAGTTIMHVTWLGAYAYHHLIGSNVALICATLVGVLAVSSRFEKGNRIYALVAMAGTYLAAPLIGYDQTLLPMLAMFLVIWNISFSAMGIFNKRRDILFIASYYAVFTVLLLSGSKAGSNQYSTLLTLQLIQFVIFSSALTAYSFIYRSALNTEESAAIFPLLLLFYVSTFSLVTSMNPELALWFSISIGLVIVGIYLLAKKYLSASLQSGQMLLSFSAIALIHGFFFQLCDESIQPLVALFLGVFVIFVWTRHSTARKDFFWPLSVLFATFLYGAVATILSTKIDGIAFVYNWAYGAVALLAVFAHLIQDQSNASENSNVTLLLGFAHSEVMLGLYRFSEKLATGGSLFVTMTWGCYAVIILGIAYARRDRVVANSALMILLAVSMKALFYDVGSTSSLARVGCLLAEGLFLYFCGWIFKKTQTWIS